MTTARMTAVALVAACLLGLTGCLPLPDRQQPGADSGSGADAAYVPQGLGGLDTALGAITVTGGYLAPGAAAESDRTATGVILSDDGAMYTAAIAVMGVRSVSVTVGGAVHEGAVLGASECLGLALVLLDGADFSYLGTGSAPAIGQAVTLATAGSGGVSQRQGTITDVQEAASGAAFADVPAATAGIPGSSGSRGAPLLDENGLVVGVSTTDAGPATSAVAVDALIAAGSLSGASSPRTIGVGAQPDPTGAVPGVWVSSVVPGSVAEQAGLRPGDVITSLGGQDLTADATLATYCAAIDAAGPTGTIPLAASRSGQTLRGVLRGTPLAG